MRILVIGAGALGGYFGAHLVRAGRDVTFMVRPHRAAQLARTGLQVTSPHGDFAVPVKTILPEGIREPFDLILLGVKSYSLDETMNQFALAVGPDTAILPVLNGMGHIDRLIARFGAAHVLGGVANISAGLDAEGRVTHFIPLHDLIFGETAGGTTERIHAVEATISNAGFDARLSDAIMHNMWEKFAQLGLGAGITCLMRAGIGDRILDELAAVRVPLEDRHLVNVVPERGGKGDAPVESARRGAELVNAVVLVHESLRDEGVEPLVHDETSGIGVMG